VYCVEDVEISALVTRLSRPHASGGVVIERAAILAAGADFPAVMDWISAHSGTPETAATSSRSRGLHGGRVASHGTAAAPPQRFVLPAGALD
jgi:purine nucleoside permease